MGRNINIVEAIMNKKLPKVFQNNLTHPVQNNRDVYYSKMKDVNTKEESKHSIRGNTVYEKIQNMFASPIYVYKIDVEIVLTNGKRIVRKVIGSQQGQLITIENEFIPISQIQDIYFHK